jgi:hypothetical protein
MTKPNRITDLSVFSLSWFFLSIVPVYRWFRQSKFPSFQRQLNLYGFKRITSGKYHLFLPKPGSVISSWSFILYCADLSFTHLIHFAAAFLLLHLAGHDKGGYYHELFLRSKRFLSNRIQRTKIKGTGARKPSSPETEPIFYNVPYLPATRALSKNPPVSFVGSMPPSGSKITLGAGGSLSLQQLVASRALAVSLLQQVQLPPPSLFNGSTYLLMEAYQAQARIQQLHMPAFHQELPMVAGFRQQHIPMVSGRQDGSTAALALALSGVKQDPFWRGQFGSTLK